jgi:hypothetical protein
MGYLFGSVASLFFGLLFLIGGITGKTMNRYALLRLPDEVARGIYIWCGVMGMTLGVVIFWAGHRS